MRYTFSRVSYYEVIDNETGLAIEKYQTEDEAEAVAEILNRFDETEPSELSVWDSADSEAVEPKIDPAFAELEQVTAEYTLNGAFETPEQPD